MTTAASLKAELATAENEVRSALAAKIDGKEDGPALEPIEAKVQSIKSRLEARQKLDAMEKSAPAEVVTGGKTEERVLKVFQNTETRANHTGPIWQAANGQAVPVLTREHRVADFVSGSSAAQEVGISGYLKSLALGPSNDLERRVLGEGTIGAGGATVPTPLAADIIDRMRAMTVSIQAGALTIPMTSQTLLMARVITDPTGGWRAENAAIVESDPVFDTVTLTAKTWAVRFQVSRELLEDGQNIDAACRNILAQSAAVALDQAILVGAGTANEPLGIRGQSGIQAVSMGVNGAAFTGWAPVLNAVQSLETANSTAVTAMVMHPRTARAINGLVDTTNQPLNAPPRIAGVPQLTTVSMPITETQGTSNNASSIITGDFSQVMIGLRTDLQIQVLQERFAEVGQIGFIAWMRADVALARPAALARIQGITP
jgi:HK97 family phage major capsid protein